LSDPRIYPPPRHGQAPDVEAAPAFLGEEFPAASQNMSFGEDFDAPGSGSVAPPGGQPSGRYESAGARGDRDVLALRGQAQEALDRAQQTLAEAEV
jgi:hypothetical protein